MAAALAAAFSLTATPAFARGWGGYGHHRHHRGIDGGDMLAGVLIRQFFLLRHRGTINWGWWAGGVAVILTVTVWLAPAPGHTGAATGATSSPGKVGFAQLRAVLDQRCVICHREAVAQKSVRLDTPAAVAAHAQQIYQQVVVTKLMPLGNATQITAEERALIGRWFTEGAKVGP